MFITAGRNVAATDQNLFLRILTQDVLQKEEENNFVTLNDLSRLDRAKNKHQP